MGRVKNIYIHRNLEELIPTLMDNTWEFKISVEEVAADVVEKARELELKWSLRLRPNCCSTYSKTFTDESCFLHMEGKESGFLRWNPPGEDVVKIVEWQQGLEVLYKLT